MEQGGEKRSLGHDRQKESDENNFEDKKEHNTGRTMGTQELWNKKLKYVPGPIGSLIGQAEVVGLRLTVNRSDELESQREGRAPIPVTKWEKKACPSALLEEVVQNVNLFLNYSLA